MMFWYTFPMGKVRFCFKKRKKSAGLPIHKRKLFKSNQDMIFEQDFAQPHSTNANQEFMETHFPSHTPTLWRYQGKHELFFLVPSGTTSGTSSENGQFILNESIATHDQSTSKE